MSMTKIAAAAIFIITIAAFMYWLWQRQPKVQPLTTPQQVQQATPEVKQESFQIKPQDTKIISGNKISIEGKSKSNQTVLIFSNNFAIATKSNKDGNFTKEVTLTNGLNFVQIVYLENDPKLSQKQYLTYYVDKKSDPAKTNVFAGSVKSIFDTVLAITWQGKEITINVAKDANIVLPKSPKDEKATASVSPLSNIRLQDFIIATGTLDKNEQLVAKNLEVVREDIPQISSQFAQITIFAAPSKNSFLAKTDKSSEAITLIIDSDSQILEGDQKMQAKDILKDKKAAVIYHSEKNQNLVDLILLLP